MVLIHAAAGRVGQAAVRLAHHYVARVIGTTSSGKHDIVRAVGADDVLDRARPDLAEEIIRLTGADLVLESVGRATFPTTLSVTKPLTGRVAVFGAACGDASLNTHDLVSSHPAQIRVCTSGHWRHRRRRSTEPRSTRWRH